MAVCIFGDMIKPIHLDHLDVSVDIFACVKTTLSLPNRVVSVEAHSHDTKLNMMERVAFIKRDHEIITRREYDVVVLCTPDNVHLIKPHPVTHHTILAQVISNLESKIGRQTAINPNILMGKSLTMDLVARYSDHHERLTCDQIKYICNGVNDEANLFYNYVCSRFLNYENCNLFKWAS